MKVPDTQAGDTYADGTPKVTVEYVVSWWAQDDRGYRFQNISQHPSIDSARRAYQLLEPDQEPTAVERRWNPSTRKWHVTDLVGRSVPRDQLATARRAGIAMVRAVLAHKRGADTRGNASSLGEVIDLSTGETTKGDKLNTRGHDHRKGAAGCPVCSKAMAENDSAQCPVCDYLCEHKHTPVHPFASLTTVPAQPDRRATF